MNRLGVGIIGGKKVSKIGERKKNGAQKLLEWM